MPLISQLIARRREQWIEVVPDEGDSLLLPVTSLPAWWECGFSVPEEEWQQTARMSSYHQMYDRACRLLTKREHFSEELRRKLSAGGNDADLIDEVLKQCLEHGYLDEKRAAETASEQLLAKGPVGAPKLLRELTRRGCAPDLAQRMVDQHCADVDNFSLALELLEGRRRSFESKFDQLERRLSAKFVGRQLEFEIRNKLSASMYSYLSTRGFGGSDGKQAIREFCNRLTGSGQD